MTLTDLYEHQIKRRSFRERLQIAQWILKDLFSEKEPAVAKPSRGRHSLLELEGLGADIWEGIDAQTYVDELRSEWNHRP